MKTITLQEFRKEPGEYFRAVQKHGRAFLLTKSGKPFARLVPVDDTIVVYPDGMIFGDLETTTGSGHGR